MARNGVSVEIGKTPVAVGVLAAVIVCDLFPAAPKDKDKLVKCIFFYLGL